MKRFASDNFGRTIVSVILGLGLAALFRKVCSDRSCIVIQGPPINEVEKKIFSLDSKCYKYKSQATSCERK